LEALEISTFRHTYRRPIPVVVAERPREGSNAEVANPASEKPPFLPILGYVLGFMIALGILAFVVAALMRLLR
jgi:hypothetical protein